MAVTANDRIEMGLRKQLREVTAQRNEAVNLLKGALPFLGTFAASDERVHAIEAFLAALPWTLE